MLSVLNQNTRHEEKITFLETLGVAGNAGVLIGIPDEPRVKLVLMEKQDIHNLLGGSIRHGMSYPLIGGEI